MSADEAQRRPFGRHSAALPPMQQPLQQQQLDSQQPYAAAHAQQYPADSGVNDATASMQQLQLQPQQPQPQPQQQQQPAPTDHASQQHILAAHSYPAAHVDDSARMSTGMGAVALVGPPLQSPSGPLTDPDGLDQSHDPTAPPLESQPATLGTDGLSWMAASSMQALPVTVYYSQDPISNLQIRVLLRRQPDEAASLTNPRTLKQLNLALKDKARRDAIAAEEAARRATEEGNTSAATAARAARATAARVDEGDEAAPDGPSDSPRGPDGRRMLSPDPLAADAFAPSVVVTQLFAWQQKVPSPAEIMLAASGARSAASYADQVRNMLRVQDPSVTGADPATMVRAAQQLLASAPDGMALSSKRDHDRYVDPDDLHKRVLASNSSAAPSLNPLAERVVLAPLAARRGQSHLTREGVATPFHILATVDLPRGGDPARIRLVNPAADELDNHPPRILGSFQKPLAALKVRESLPSSGGSGSGSGGVGQVTLEMRPPFSPPQKDPTCFDDAEWYTFATPSGEVYRYRLENFSALQEGDTEAAALASASASASASGAKAARSSRSYIAIEESRLAAEAARISAQEMALKMRRSGRDFDRGPPPGYAQWHVYGEVIKLSGFDEEDLSVAYEVDLRGVVTGPGSSGASWSASVDSVLQAVSQRSQALFARHTVAGRPDVREAYLAFPIELKLRAKIGPFLPPILYFQVNATNRWGMSGVVGYAFAHLPSTAGCHELELETWAPVGTLRDRKTAFFVGAGPALRDIKLCGLPGPEGEEGGPGGGFGFGFGLGLGAAGLGLGLDPPRSGSRPGVLNRYGWECTGKGTVHVRLEMIELVAAAPTPSDSAAVPHAQHRALALTNLREQAIAQAMAAGATSSGSSARDSARDELHALRQSTLTQRASARR